MQFTRTLAPLPKTKRTPPVNVNRASKYDFAGMQVGESDLTTDFVDGKKAVARLNSATTAYKKRSGDTRRFAVRLYNDEELKCEVLGVWCLAAKEAKAVAPTADAGQAQAEGQEQTAEAEQAAE